MKRRHVLAATALTALPMTGSWAQAYPVKPIRWINPFPAGSPTDAVARKLAEMVSPIIGQPIVVDNKPGANGSIGTMEVVRAAPDGYTFGIAIADSLISVASLLKTPGYDARKDLTPVIQISVAQSMVFANTQSGIKSIPDLIKAAKAAPGKVAYGSWGQGTLPHLIMSTLERQTGATFLHVPYKGLSPIMTDLVGGTVQVSVGPPALIKQFMDKGLVRPLAVLGPERTAFLPEVPTMSEQGVDAEFLRGMFWTGLVAPRDISPAMLKRWVDALSQVIMTPEFTKFLAIGAGGQIPRIKGPEQFARDIATEYAMTNELIRSIGIEPQ